MAGKPLRLNVTRLMQSVRYSLIHDSARRLLRPNLSVEYLTVPPGCLWFVLSSYPACGPGISPNVEHAAKYGSSTLIDSLDSSQL